MSPRLTKKRAPSTAPQREALIWAKDRVAVATVGFATGGLRVDLKRLGENEQHELIGLLRDATTDGGGINLSQLADRRERFEQLVEDAAGEKRGSVFEKERGLAELRRMGDRFRAEKQKPPRRAKLEEEGAVTLRKQWVFDYLRDSILWPSHLTVLLYLMTIYENGDVPLPWAGVSYDGEAITIDLRRGNFMPDPEGTFVHPESLLEHLEANKFIEISKKGRVWEIRPGLRLRQLRAA